MLQQEAMIERTRHVFREDERPAAAMMYCSFDQGEGDGFSDIEFILFYEELENLDQDEWVSRISPVGLYFVNEYGNGTAIFENLVRVLEGSTLHWFNSSNFLETEISETSYARYVACTASLDRGELQQAHLSAWGWGRELMSSLGERHGVTLPATLLRRLDRHFAETFGGAGLEGS